ncbi:TAXI family TRAP transporter solute-binding subunit [Eubacteriales bacterium OttesenSCG-928-K08]|nr:TAXI family TRAP transporter solute-binding subunit [Eubacteriales bacterium OttesenSCG-928-K08]
MKKTVALLMVLALAFGAVACGGGGGGSTGTTQTQLSMVTGGESGTYYAYGGMIASVISEALGNVAITASTSGASAANARSINKKDADLALLQNDVLDYAYNGIEGFVDDGKLQNVAAIGTLYPEVIQIVATDASGITSVADLAGKRVSVGDLGSGVEANARQILDIYGMSYDDLGKVEYLGFGDSSTAIQQMTIDAAFVTAGVPNPAIMELNTTVAVHLVPVNGAEADALIAKYPFYAKYNVDADAYEGKAGLAGVETVAILATLACNKELDEEIVYQITKTLFESKDKINHDKAKLLSPEAAVQGLSIPFHPGAEKYFKEVGVLQ